MSLISILCIESVLEISLHTEILKSLIIYSIANRRLVIEKLKNGYRTINQTVSKKQTKKSPKKNGREPTAIKKEENRCSPLFK